MATKKIEEKTHTERKNLERQSYITIDIVKSTAKVCSRCSREMIRNEKYLYLVRHRHTFLVCGKCLVIATAEVLKDNPAIKGDALAEII